MGSLLMAAQSVNNKNNKQAIGASILGNIWKGDGDDNWGRTGVVQDVEGPKVGGYRVETIIIGAPTPRVG